MTREVFHPARLAALALALALAACDGGGSNLPQVPARLTVVSGNEQTADPGKELPQPVVVRVEDDRGRPVKGQVVNFVVTEGGGFVYAGTAITNSDGEARERWTVGTYPGQRLEARAVDDQTGEPLLFATFTAKLTGEGVPTAIQRDYNGPEPILGVAGSTVDSLSVTVRDRYGRPVQGATVTWAATNGATVSPATSVTDVNGVAKSRLTLGAAGTFTATATLNGASPVQWAAETMTPAAMDRIFYLQPEYPNPAPGQVLPAEWVGVRVRSAQGAYMNGVPLTYTVIAGGGSVTPTQTVTGGTPAVLTLGPQEGVNTVRVTVAGLPPLDISYFAKARIPFGSVRMVPDTLRLPVGGIDTLHAQVRSTSGTVVPEPGFHVILAPWDIHFSFENRISSFVEVQSLRAPLSNSLSYLRVRALAPGEGWVVARLQALPYYVVDAGPDLTVHTDSTYVIVQ